ncbi:unnamed protein product, partial [Amoebophrya sp. A25]
QNAKNKRKRRKRRRAEGSERRRTLSLRPLQSDGYRFSRMSEVMQKNTSIDKRITEAIEDDAEEDEADDVVAIPSGSPSESSGHLHSSHHQSTHSPSSRNDENLRITSGKIKSARFTKEAMKFGHDRMTTARRGERRSRASRRFSTAGRMTRGGYTGRLASQRYSQQR